MTDEIKKVLAEATPRPWKWGEVFTGHDYDEMRTVSEKDSKLSLLAVNSYETDQERLKALTEALGNLDCAECGHKYKDHTPAGCEYERGDGYQGDAEFLQAMGPCDCTGQQYLEDATAIDALSQSKPDTGGQP